MSLEYTRLFSSIMLKYSKLVSNTRSIDYRNKLGLLIKKNINFANPNKFGVWRRWLACLHGVQEVVSSSLTTPTK